MQVAAPQARPHLGVLQRGMVGAQLGVLVHLRSERDLAPLHLRLSFAQPLLEAVQLRGCLRHNGARGGRCGQGGAVVNMRTQHAHGMRLASSPRRQTACRGLQRRH